MYLDGLGKEKPHFLTVLNLRKTICEEMALHCSPKEIYILLSLLTSMDLEAVTLLRTALLKTERHTVCLKKK